MKWSACHPTHPGYYLALEQDNEPILLQVDVESDSHSMFYVLIPGDGRKYPIDLWQDAYWYGPISGA